MNTKYQFFNIDATTLKKYEILQFFNYKKIVNYLDKTNNKLLRMFYCDSVDYEKTYLHIPCTKEDHSQCLVKENCPINDAIIEHFKRCDRKTHDKCLVEYVKEDGSTVMLEYNSIEQHLNCHYIESDDIKDRRHNFYYIYKEADHRIYANLGSVAYLSNMIIKSTDKTTGYEKYTSPEYRMIRQIVCWTYKNRKHIKTILCHDIDNLEYFKDLMTDESVSNNEKIINFNLKVFNDDKSIIITF